MFQQISTTMVAGLLWLALTGCTPLTSSQPDMASQTTATTADCNEACLLGLAGKYMDALSDNHTASAPISTSFRRTENGVDAPIGSGIWTTAEAWSYRHTFVDSLTGGIGIFGIVRETSGADAILAIRLKADGKTVSESEALVVREGEFPLFKTDMTVPREAFYRYVPPSRQSSRDALIAIAKGYFTGLSTGDPSGLDFHPDCNRRENGYQTTNNPPRMALSCADLYPFVYMQSFRTPDFPIVDVDRGLVLGITAFDMPEMTETVMIRGKPFNITPERQRLPRSLFLYELFKVDNGQIVAIEAFLMNTEYGQKMGWGER